MVRVWRRTMDCLLIGFNDTPFRDYVETVRAMGEQSGAFQDLRLAYVDHEGEPLRALDLLTRLHNEEFPDRPQHFHNSDFLWPVITYLGTYLHRAGLSFDYVNLFHLEKDRLREKLQSQDVLTVAITTTLYVSAQPIIEIVEFVRRYNKKAKIVIGGPYIANQAQVVSGPDLEALLDYLGGDIYVIGREGEKTLTRLIKALRAGDDLSTVPNLAYRKGDTFALTLPEVESNPLEENMVDYDLFPPGAINEFITTRTAKSCPFSCAFCGFPQRAGKYTYLDLEYVEKELDRLSRLPHVNTITFIDDTFNVPKVRFREILRLMIDKGYGFRWNSFYRSDHGDVETIRLMREAGCEGVFLGIESGSDAMLKRMNKTARRKHYLTALEAFNEVGISAYASLIVGFPGETEETVAETISLIEEGRPDFYRAQLWYADPVTPIWQQRNTYGIRGEAFNWSHDTMDSATACDIINDMFTSVKNSIWLPQFGFEQWSVFYLQRRGMTLDQVKTFLRHFNAAVADQMAHPGRTFIEPGILASLRESARFHVVTPA
ncbi:PhpK family radical SAM P-methyltransferase [Streptomyces sp. NPDC006134]|uniref:PhpK family radical SAM P-methyltransferase n=1 Tax=Streptomyces sp. NPDC006134 TaxID=3154467 RepID=UPI0033E942B0